MAKILKFGLVIIIACLLYDCSSGTSATSSTVAQNSIIVGGNFSGQVPGITALSNESGSWTAVNNNTESSTVFFDVNTASGQILVSGGFFDMGFHPIIILSNNSGLSWIRATVPLTKSAGLLGIIYANNMYVATGGDITGQFGESATIMISFNGVDWASAIYSSIPYDTLYRVTYGNGKFVTVGGNGSNGHSIVQTSTNGITWESQTPNTESGVSLVGVTYGNGKFIAAGGNLTSSTTKPVIAYSNDGINWAIESITSAPAGTTFVAVKFLNNQFVAVGGSQVNPSLNAIILTSQDGVNWTVQSNDTPSGSVLSGVGYVNGSYIAVGNNILGSGNGLVVTSPDAISWTIQDSGQAAGSSLYAVAGYN